MKKFFLYVLSLLLFYCNNMLYAEEILNLKKAVEIALNNSSVIKEAMYNEKVALENKRSALSNMLPKLSAEYSYAHLKYDPIVYFHTGPVTQEIISGYRNTYSWSITAVQPIFTGLALFSNYKISSIGLDREKLLLDVAKLDVTFEVKKAYFNVLMEKRMVEVMEEEVAQLKAHLEDARNFYEQGIIPKNDLLKSEVAYSIAEQKLERSKSEFNVAVSNLNRVLSFNINKRLVLQDITSLPDYRGKLEDLIDTALKKRPEILAMNKAIEQAKWAVRMAKGRFAPTISVFGKYERQGDDFEANENIYTNEKNFILGVQAKWEFFESGKKFFDVRREKYRLRSLLEKKKTLEDQIALQVKKAYEELKVARKNVDTAYKALDQAKENFRVTNEGYKVQVNTSTDVLDARAYLTESEMNYYNSLYGYHIALAAVKRAIGEY